jgi:beta-lactamase regulating signal transducer with metallopeptidase domain
MNHLFQLWHQSLLPLLIWWALLCGLIILLGEWEHRIILKRLVARRAATWRLVLFVIFVIPIFVILNPIQITIPFDSLRPINNMLYHTWDSKQDHLKDTPPENAHFSVMDKNDEPFRWQGFGLNLPKVRTPINANISILLALIYIAGILRLLFKFWVDSIRLSTFIQSTKLSTNPELIDILQSLKKKAGLECEVDIRICNENISPAVINSRIPILLLPQELIKSWQLHDISPIILHELYHLKYRDHLYETISRILWLLLWFLPPIHWLRFRLDETREALCDANAAAVCESNKEYANLLVRLAENLLPYPAIHAASSFVQSGPKILQRLDHLKESRYQKNIFHSTDQKVLWISVWICFLLVIGGLRADLPIHYIYSIIEPHPQTNNNADFYLSSHKNLIKNLAEKKHLHANIHHKFFTPAVSSKYDGFPDCNIDQILERNAEYQEWFYKDLRKIEIQDQFTYLPGNDEEKQSPKIESKLFSNKATRHHTKPDNRFFQDSLLNHLDGPWENTVHDIINNLQNGERIAQISLTQDQTKITITPTRGIGYKVIWRITPDTTPQPSSIEYWRNDILKEKKEFTYSSDKKLKSMNKTCWGNQQRSKGFNHQDQFSRSRISYTIHQLHADYDIDEDFFDAPTVLKEDWVGFRKHEFNSKGRLAFHYLYPYSKYSKQLFQDKVTEYFQDSPPSIYTNKGYSIQDSKKKEYVSCLFSKQLVDITVESNKNLIWGIAAYNHNQRFSNFLLNNGKSAKTHSFRQYTYKMPFSIPPGHDHNSLLLIENRDYLIDEKDITAKEFSDDFDFWLYK